MLPEVPSQWRFLSEGYTVSSGTEDPPINTAPCKRIESFWKFPSLALPPLCLPTPTLKERKKINSICYPTVKPASLLKETNWGGAKLIKYPSIFRDDPQFVHVDETVKYKRW